MPDQRPVDEVRAVVDRDAGEELKSRGRDEVVVADAADGRVRVEAR